MRLLLLVFGFLFSINCLGQTTVTSELEADFKGNRFLYIEHGANTFSLMGDNYTFTNTEESPGPKRLSIRYISYSGKVHEYKNFWVADGFYQLTGKVNDENSWKVYPEHPYNQIDLEIESADLTSRKKLIFDYLDSELGQEKLNKFKNDFSREELVAALEQFSSDSWYHGEITTYLTLSESTLAKIGQKAPDFTLESLSGKDFVLSEQIGKYSLIEFSFTGCKYCMMALPELKKLQEELGDQIQIVTVWKDPKRDTWLNVMKEEKSQITWSSLWDPNGLASALFEINLWPTYALVDPDGNLKFIWSGYKKGDNLSRKIIRAMETGRP